MIPAWGRAAVTRLALTGHKWLQRRLSDCGVALDVVVIADDSNCIVAVQHDFDAIWHENVLGAKINAGFRYALEHGADYAAFIGSDDWLHPHLFDPLDGERVVAGHAITVIDLVKPRMRHLGWRAHCGVPPWFLPRRVLERCDGQPVADPSAMRGMEGEILRGIDVLPYDWVMHDPHPLARIDFKSDVGMTDFEVIGRACGIGEVIADPWSALAEKYPGDLVEQAEHLSFIYQTFPGGIKDVVVSQEVAA